MGAVEITAKLEVSEDASYSAPWVGPFRFRQMVSPGFASSQKHVVPAGETVEIDLSMFSSVRQVILYNSGGVSLAVSYDSAEGDSGSQALAAGALAALGALDPSVDISIVESGSGDGELFIHALGVGAG